MISKSILLSICAAWLPLAAQTSLPTIRVSSETAPPGGLAQMKVLLTSPKPITSGNMDLDMSDVSFDSIDGIALFNSSGDVGGAAVVNNGKVNVQFTSPKGTFGVDADYPLLTVALTLSNSVVPGQSFPVTLNPSASIWDDLLGAPIAFEFQQGKIAVGGSVSITNVIPGGGTLPGGATFSIYGIGFTPQTKVSLRGVNASNIQYVSPTQFVVTLRETGTLDGALITVQNPDNSIDTYYSYMRGVPVGQSSRALLARTTPVFSIATANEAILPSTISSQVNPDYFTALALQNPNAASVNVTVEAHTANGALMGSQLVTLPSGARISREVSEWFGATLPTGGYLHIASAQAVQVLGLLGNDRSGVVLPVMPDILSGPAIGTTSESGTESGSGSGSAGSGKGGGGSGGSGGGGGKGN
jgi:uncharacterized membrane protein YgcG